MKLTFFDFIRGQLGEKVPPVPTKDLKGQTVVVTGANIGIGFEAAKHFARMNPGKLIIACRSKARGEEALQSIRADTGCTTAELRLLDLSNFASVKSFVQTFEDNNDRLDILVENAAIYNSKAAAEFTEDGWETSVYVNNLATSLLALLLLPRMIDTAKKFNTNPRLVVVGSEVHYWTKFAEKDVFSENFFRTYAYKDSKLLRGRLDKLRYYDTKLLNIFFTRSLAEKLGKGPVIVNTVNPGFCLSNLRRDADGLQAILFWVLDTFLARTAEQGSRQLVWAAIGQNGDLDELRGAYISSMEVMEPSDYIVKGNGKAVQDKLWDDLLAELTQVDARVTDVVRNYRSQ